MRKHAIIAALLIILSIGVIGFSIPASIAATTTDPERQMADLPIIKKEILTYTQYNTNDVNIAIKDDQIWVHVLNSKLNKVTARERENEASLIVSTITKTIESRPEFGSIIGIHIDYLAKSIRRAHLRIIDGIDFRKDPSGNFVHNKT